METRLPSILCAASSCESSHKLKSALLPNKVVTIGANDASFSCSWTDRFHALLGAVTWDINAMAKAVNQDNKTLRTKSGRNLFFVPSDVKYLIPGVSRAVYLAGRRFYTPITSPQPANRSRRFEGKQLPHQHRHAECSARRAIKQLPLPPRCGTCTSIRWRQSLSAVCRFLMHRSLFLFLISCCTFCWSYVSSSSSSFWSLFDFRSSSVSCGCCC